MQKVNLNLCFRSFLSQSGQSPNKSHQLAENAAKPAKLTDKFNSRKSKIKNQKI